MWRGNIVVRRPEAQVNIHPNCCGYRTVTERQANITLWLALGAPDSSILCLAKSETSGLNATGGWCLWAMSFFLSPRVICLSKPLFVHWVRDNWQTTGLFYTIGWTWPCVLRLSSASPLTFFGFGDSDHSGWSPGDPPCFGRSFFTGVGQITSSAAHLSRAQQLLAVS